MTLEISVIDERLVETLMEEEEQEEQEEEEERRREKERRRGGAYARSMICLLVQDEKE